MLNRLLGRGRARERAGADIDQSLVLSAGGGISGPGAAEAAGETAAAIFAADMLGHCLALAEIAPANMRTAAITPALLQGLGRQLLLDGESVYWIDMLGRDVRLRAADSWNIEGGYRAEAWIYYLSLSGPSQTYAMTASAGAVLHAMYAVDQKRPWQGITPLSGISAKLSGALEGKLALEIANAVQAFLVPAPGDPSDTRFDGLRKDLASMRGHTTMVPTMASGFDMGRASAPPSDWKPVRLGANPPESLIDLRMQTVRSTLAACGILPGLFSDNGQAQREAFRQYYLRVLVPVSEMLARELSDKLGTEITLDLRRVGAGDVQQRARAAAALAKAGVDVGESLALAGLAD
ncbi:MAG: hypothetical protein OXI18_11550 [bacterium]|nr:hypothetical protein [bacterium]